MPAGVVSIEQLKEALGSAAEGRSDEELARINDLLGRLAGTLFESWRRELVASNIAVEKPVVSDTI